MSSKKLKFNGKTKQQTDLPVLKNTFKESYRPYKSWVASTWTFYW